MLCAPKPHAYYALLGAALLAASIALPLPAQTVGPAQPAAPGPLTIYLAQQPERSADPVPPPDAAVEPPETETPPVVPEGPSVRPTPMRTTAPGRRPLTGMRLASARSPALRLASVPNMLGDFFSPTMQLDYVGPCQCPVTAQATVPLAAGGRRLKISENNKALPMDRCYFVFQHFHNVIDTDPDVAAFFTGRSASLNRYTLGFEKTFFEEQCSVDIRLPLAENYRYGDSVMEAEGGNVGDFTLIFKALLLSTDTNATAIGLGVGTPTGDDANGRIFNTRYSLKNQAIHLSPFIGFLCVPSEQFFLQGFLEVDFPTQGNRFDIEDPRTGSFDSAGYLNEQTLLKVDVAGGWWIYRSLSDYGPCGIAAIAEFHYTTTVQDADVLSFQAGNGSVRFGDLLNRRDVSNVSVGLHTLLHGRTSLRVSAVFPVENRLDNPFDAEVNVSLNRYR